MTTIKVFKKQLIPLFRATHDLGETRDPENRYPAIFPYHALQQNTDL